MTTIVSIDIETTGPDSSKDVIIEIGAVKFKDHRIEDEFSSLALPGRNAWILVLDTKGINVWCAAGKGTFGTAGLVARITACGLNQIVSHRQVILPQLQDPVSRPPSEKTVRLQGDLRTHPGRRPARFS